MDSMPTTNTDNIIAETRIKLILAFPMDEIIRKYLVLRRMVEEIKERHKAELKDPAEAMKAIEAAILSRMNAEGVQNFATREGTAYQTVHTSASIVDWNDFALLLAHQMVIAVTTATPDNIVESVKASFIWDLLERRVNKTSVLSFIEQEGRPPPGVKVSQVVNVNVRKAD